MNKTCCCCCFDSFMLLDFPSYRMYSNKNLFSSNPKPTRCDVAIFHWYIYQKKNSIFTLKVGTCRNRQWMNMLDWKPTLREKCGLHTPIFLRFARQSLTHLHAFFDGVHTSMLALLRHPNWTFFSVKKENVPACFYHFLSNTWRGELCVWLFYSQKIQIFFCFLWWFFWLE